MLQDYNINVSSLTKSTDMVSKGDAKLKLLCNLVNVFNVFNAFDDPDVPPPPIPPDEFLQLLHKLSLFIFL